MAAVEEEGNPFASLSDDVILKILFKLEEDPATGPASTASPPSSPPSSVPSAGSPSAPSSLLPLPSCSSAWSSIHKLSVCCPGLLHSGILLDNSDFRLLRNLGPNRPFPSSDSHPAASSSSGKYPNDLPIDVPGDSSSARGWKLFDDLFHDTVYGNCEDSASIDDGGNVRLGVEEGGDLGIVRVGKEVGRCKRKKIFLSMRSHMASGARNLCREQGNKLLASRFRGDCLYICNWPGCIHIGDKRNYMLFRGVLKNFKRSSVWRTVNHGNRSNIDLNCAFCSCKQTWDLHSAFS